LILNQPKTRLVISCPYRTPNRSAVPLGMTPNFGRAAT
jgi:hypothetical protein